MMKSNRLLRAATANLLRQVVAKIPADPANNSPVRAMQLIKGFIAKKSFP
jgi:hypothetical protein